MFKIQGLEEMQRRLEEVARGVEKLEGTHTLDVDELFPQAFMRANTEFTSFEGMVNASGFHVESADDFAKIPDEEWDAFVSSRTRFASWEEMMGEATSEWAVSKLGF